MKITIAAVGDIFLGRYVEHTINKKGPDHIFDRIRAILCEHDIVVGNLESPISGDIFMSPENEHRLIAKPAALDGLKRAGFNAVSLANNHIMDFGLPALQHTLHELEKREIGYAGAGLDPAQVQRPLEKIGTKSVSLLAYYGLGKGGNVKPAPSSAQGNNAAENGGHNSGNIHKVLQDIRHARKKADVVLVAVHWPVSDLNLPMKHQVELARQMIDHGATLVLGSGPHVLQPVEQYNGGVIAYSLGNFVFDHDDREELKHSMILDLSVVNGKVEEIKIIPVQINAAHCPEPIDPDQNPELYESIQSLLVHQLEEFASDTHILSNIRLRSLTPKKILRKISRREQGVYPLAFYVRGLAALLKEKYSSR